MTARFINLVDGEVRALKTCAPVLSESSKRGSTPSYQVQFVRNAVVVELADSPGPVVPVVTLAFKEKNDFDSTHFILGTFTAVKSGTGASTIYTFTPDFSGAKLDAVLVPNLASVELDAEIKWTSLNENSRTLAFSWIVENNVNRGGET